MHRLNTDLASRIAWFDAFVSNVDRTPRNTNMLMWHGAPWLIDHGSTLYFHHAPGWESKTARSRAPFDRIRDHVLLEAASTLPEDDRALTVLLTADVIAEVLSLVPDAWIGQTAAEAEAGRRAYHHYFVSRLEAPRHFVEEAVRAR